MAKKRIMVVDDEANILELVRAILSNEGYEVITANNGPECLKKLETVKPDLLLIDIMMPKMSGKELCRQIKDNPKTKDLKVAFLTVVRYSETGKEALLKLKSVDYITKPFNNDYLIERVKKIIG